MPGGATINGIECALDAKEATSDVTLDVGIFDSTNNYRVKAQGLTTSDTTYTLGGAADLWSGTWDAAEFADSEFKMYIKYNASLGTASVDGIQFKIYYTPAGPGNLKSLNTNLKANVKSYNTNLIANVKSINTNV